MPSCTTARSLMFSSCSSGSQPRYERNIQLPPPYNRAMPGIRYAVVMSSCSEPNSMRRAPVLSENSSPIWELRCMIAMRPDHGSSRQSTPPPTYQSCPMSSRLGSSMRNRENTLKSAISAAPPPSHSATCSSGKMAPTATAATTSRAAFSWFGTLNGGRSSPGRSSRFVDISPTEMRVACGSASGVRNRCTFGRTRPSCACTPPPNASRNTAPHTLASRIEPLFPLSVIGRVETLRRFAHPIAPHHSPAAAHHPSSEMHDLRSDTAPLPVVELAPLRLTSSDPAEPFLLGAGPAAEIGYCRLSLAALRLPAGDVLETAGVPVHAVITPCGVVRTARIGDVGVTERVALIGDPLTSVHQWTVDTDAELVLEPGRHHRLAAGDTVTALSGAKRSADIEKDFRTLAAGLARALREGIALDTRDNTGAALAWAAARLWLHIQTGGAPTLAAALAAPVTGHPEQLRLHLQRAELDALPLLAARYAAWTGAVQDVRPILPRLKDSTATAAADDIGRALRLAGMAELERTAADLGEHSFAADLRALGRRLQDEQSGRGLEPPAAALLAALAAGGAGSDPDPAPASDTETDDVAYHGWLTWAALQQGQLTRAGPAWRRLLAAADTPVRAAWPARFGTVGDDAAATALFVLTLAHGLLGLQPDAPR